MNNNSNKMNGGHKAAVVTHVKRGAGASVYGWCSIFSARSACFSGLRLEKKKPDKSADEKLEIQHESPPAKGTEVPQVSF